MVSERPGVTSIVPNESPWAVAGFKFFVSRFYYKSYTLSASSVSTNGTSMRSNANRFAALIKFPEMVHRTGANRLNPTTVRRHIIFTVLRIAIGALLPL